MRREFSLAVKKTAFAKAYRRCEQCGSEEQLECHHRGHNRDTSLFNCVVLCHVCHHKEHMRRKQLQRGLH